MENKGKTRRIRKAAWAAFMLPFMAVGANSLREQENCSEELKYLSRNELCGDQAPRDPIPYVGFGAQDVDYYEQPYFVYDYFVNLKEHLPFNNAGNCGYTGLAMLLSYYDTYWNGDIIPPQYNNHDYAQLSSPKDTSFSSPGVLDYAADLKFPNGEMPEPDSNSKQEYIDKYYDNLRKGYTDYLDYMLARTGDNLISEFYDLALDNTGVWKSKIWDFQANCKPAINLDGLRNLVERYFIKYHLGGKAELVAKWYTDYTKYPINDSKIAHKLLRRDAIERLMQGQPLLVQGKLSTKSQKDDPNASVNGGGGHVAVAYGYEKGSNTIVGHMGWKYTDTTKVSIDEAFATIDGFAYLDVKPNLEFTPWNYRFTTDNKLNACELSSHVHTDHLAMIPYDDDEYHALQCVCGDVTYEKHAFTVRSLDPFEGIGHVYECECGKTVVERHHFRISGFNSMVCSKCGYTIPLMPEFLL